MRRRGEAHLVHGSLDLRIAMFVPEQDAKGGRRGGGQGWEGADDDAKAPVDLRAEGADDADHVARDGRGGELVLAQKG